MLFHVLGPVEVHTASVRGLGAGKPAAVLAALLLEPNAWVTVDRLVEDVWPEQDAPASAPANLRTYVWQLRRMLPDGGIERRADAYRITVAPGELDADLAASLAADARRQDPATAVTLVERALALWRGRPFSGIETAATAAAVTRLDELRLDLREQLAALHLGLGRTTDAVSTLRAVTAEAPLREAAWAALVGALHATGRRAEALTAYRQATRILAVELDVEPGPALLGAWRSALGDASVTPDDTRATGGDVPVSPIRRELPRDVRLVGRSEPLAALERDRPLVVVHGMPGSGKTALAVHAAHRLAPDHPDGQFFIHLHGGDRQAGAGHRHAGGGDRRVRGGDRGGPLRPEVALDRLLRGAGVAPYDIPVGLDERSALWRSTLAGRRVLIVLDDAADADQVLPLLPAGDTCRTVVTTRHRGWHVPGAARIALEPLGGRSAATLFAAAAGIPPTGAAVAAVVGHCGGLPAALLDAAARLRTRPHWTVPRLAAELHEDPCRVLPDACRRLDGHGSTAWRALGHLPATFDVAAAARALALPSAATRAALDTLVDHGLLDATAADSYRGHPLVRHVAACGAPVVRSLGEGRAA